MSSNPPANDAGLRYYVVANNKVLLHDIAASIVRCQMLRVYALIPPIAEPSPKAAPREMPVSGFKEAWIPR
jgi:hypothetical protein